MNDCFINANVIPECCQTSNSFSVEKGLHRFSETKATNDRQNPQINILLSLLRLVYQSHIVFSVKKYRKLVA